MTNRTINITMAAIAMVGGWGAMPFPAAAATAQASAEHERVIPLQGGRNFRDLGGYRTADGRHVKWGMLYRSGSMHGLTPADYTTLERRGIRVVCDLRDSRERAAEPVAWPHAGAPRLLFDDYTLDQGFVPAGPPATWTPQQARDTMTASYPRMLVQFNGQYRRMFAELLAGHAPLAFNCSAGKDRTGIAAALLLTALGVPRDTVIADYELTNTTLNAAALMAPGNKATSTSVFTKVSPEVAAPFIRADRAYLLAALAVVDAHDGGAAGYLRAELGLGAAEIARLRKLYLD